VELNDHVAFITGAAGGIGSAIARLFAAEGAAVALVDQNLEAITELEKSLTEQGLRAQAVQSDVRSAASVKAAVEAVLHSFGKINLCVNAVGILRQGRVDEMSEADWDILMDVNVKGVFLACKYVVPALKAAGGGAIVNLSSVAAFVGSDGSFAYSTTKGAVSSLTFGIAQELAPFGIRVNAICPGWVDTPINYAHADLLGGLQKVYDGISSFQPICRPGEPREIAHLVLFLASDEASFITGSVISADGGMSAM